ncbi:unnamed protein product, partial [Mesorhabditis spiculigera]
MEVRVSKRQLDEVTLRVKWLEFVYLHLEKAHMNCVELMTRDELKKRDVHGQTALHIAAKLSNLEAVKYFCSAIPELRDVSSNIGEIPATIAAGVGQMPVLEVLLLGSNKEAAKMAMHRDVNGTSALMAAVARGDNDMAFWLLKRFGKNLAMVPNSAQMIPLHVAAAQGNIEFIRIVTKYSSEMGGCLTSVRYLVEKAHSEMGSVSNRGQSLLHIACLAGHAHIAKWLLARMSPDAALWTTNDQANAVHCAAFSGSVPVLQVLLGEWSKRKRGQVLSLRDSRGNTPLHLTAINNHHDAAVFLLDNGAEKVLVNSAGHAAQAIASMRGHHDLAKLLSAQSDLVKGKRKERESGRSRRSAAEQQRVTSPASTAMVSPIEITTMNTRATTALSHRMHSPQQMSSGYDSSGASEAGVDIVERRPMRYVEDDEGLGSASPSFDSKKDQEAQTDEDLLVDHIKIIDDREWTAAVAQIDRVLEEVEQIAI